MGCHFTLEYSQLCSSTPNGDQNVQNYSFFSSLFFFLFFFSEQSKQSLCAYSNMGWTFVSHFISSSDRAGYVFIGFSSPQSASTAVVRTDVHPESPLEKRKHFPSTKREPRPEKMMDPIISKWKSFLNEKKVELMSCRKSVAGPRRASRGPRFHPNISASSPGSHNPESCCSSLCCQTVSHKLFDLGKLELSSVTRRGAQALL